MPSTGPSAAGLPLAVVLNPAAGRGLAGRTWPRLEAALNARGLAFELLHAGSAREACAALAARPAGQAALAVGGDGTASLLLPELVRSGRALGLVPLGSGNDLAGSLGLRPGDLDSALDRLSRPEGRLDLMEVRLDDRPPVLLLNGLGMGYDAQVADLLHRAPARLLGVPLGGFPRYLWAALRGLRQLESGPLTVEVDGEVLYRGASCLVAVMNSERYGGGFRIAPGADPRDGQLNVVLGGNLSRAALLPLMGRVLRGTHLTHPAVREARGREVRLSWERPMQTHLDGELAGAQRQLTVRVLPGALRCLSLP